MPVRYDKVLASHGYGEAFTGSGCARRDWPPGYAAGWHVCDVEDANIHAAQGVAIREFPLAEGSGSADYLLDIDGRAAGVIEAKKFGATLTGVERRSVAAPSFDGSKHSYE